MRLEENQDHSQDKDQKQPSTPNSVTNFLQKDVVNVTVETVHSRVLEPHFLPWAT